MPGKVEFSLYHSHTSSVVLAHIILIKNLLFGINLFNLGRNKFESSNVNCRKKHVYDPSLSVGRQRNRYVGTAKFQDSLISNSFINNLRHNRSASIEL